MTKLALILTGIIISELARRFYNWFMKDTTEDFFHKESYAIKHGWIASSDKNYERAR